MAFATRSIDGQTLVNNVTGLAKSAKIFKVPTVVAAKASAIDIPDSSGGIPQLEAY